MGNMMFDANFEAMVKERMSLYAQGELPPMMPTGVNQLQSMAMTQNIAMSLVMLGRSGRDEEPCSEMRIIKKRPKNAKMRVEWKVSGR